MNSEQPWTTTKSNSQIYDAMSPHDDVTTIQAPRLSIQRALEPPCWYRLMRRKVRRDEGSHSGLLGISELTLIDLGSFYGLSTCASLSCSGRTFTRTNCWVSNKFRNRWLAAYRCLHKQASAPSYLQCCTCDQRYILSVLPMYNVLLSLSSRLFVVIYRTLISFLTRYNALFTNNSADKCLWLVDDSVY